MQQTTLDSSGIIRSSSKKYYARYKTHRKGELLSKVRARCAGKVLDERTIRKQTNLASAEASRKKKDFMLNELSKFLRLRDDDAKVLTEELKDLAKKCAALQNDVDNLKMCLEHLDNGNNRERFAHSIAGRMKSSELQTRFVPRQQNVHTFMKPQLVNANTAGVQQRGFVHPLQVNFDPGVLFDTVPDASFSFSHQQQEVQFVEQQT